MTPTTFIVLIIATAIVVVVVAAIYRNRLTEGSFKGDKDGIQASIKAALPNQPPETETDSATWPAAGVVIKGTFTDTTINKVAGRDVVDGKPSKKMGGDTPGVTIDGNFSDSDLKNIAGRDKLSNVQSGESDHDS